METIETKEKVFIKEQNYWAIHDFAYRFKTDHINGTKLEALYQLIQNKGRFLGVPSDHKFYKLKVLEYADGDFIGFIRTGYTKSSFFPCKLKTVAFRLLD